MLKKAVTTAGYSAPRNCKISTTTDCPKPNESILLPPKFDV